MTDWASVLPWVMMPILNLITAPFYKAVGFLFEYTMHRWFCSVYFSMMYNDPAFPYLVEYLSGNMICFAARYEDDRQLPSGLCISTFGTAWISHSDSSSQPNIRIHIYFTWARWDALRAEIEAKRNRAANQQKEMFGAGKNITYLYRSGSYGNFSRSRLFILDTFRLTAQQLALKERIDRVFRRKRVVIVFLHGQPGTGKTTFGSLLARDIGAVYTDEFEPCGQHMDFATLYSAAEPTVTRPLVVCVDEADSVFRNVMPSMKDGKEGKSPSGGYGVRIYDKRTLNTWLDRIQKRYQNVILILTSNVPKEEIDALDPSFLARHRVNLCAEFTEVFKVEEETF